MMIEEVKALLTIKHTDLDEYITAALPEVIHFASTYVGEDWFDLDNQAYTVPVGVRLFVAKAVEFHLSPSGLQNDSIGDNTVRFQHEYPPALLQMLDMYAEAKGTKRRRGVRFY